MLISATGKNKQPYKNTHNGFSLIEVVVVMLIVALAASAIFVSVGVSDVSKKAHTSAENTAFLIRFLNDKALIEQETYGLVFFDSSYAFMQFDVSKQVWNIIENDKVLGIYRLPGSLSYDLAVSGRHIGLNKEVPGKHKPQVVVNGAGEMSTFQLSIRDEDATYEIVTVANNEVEIKTIAH